MMVLMLTRYSPTKGQRLERGAVVEVPDEVAVDLVGRGLAEPVRLEPERAVGPGQKDG